MDLSSLGMLFSVGGGGSKPTLLFDGDISTSSSQGYTDFTIDKEYTILIVIPECSNGSYRGIGVCIVIPMYKIGENDTNITFYGNPNGTASTTRGFIKRIGNTVSVRSYSSSFAHLTIYGI